MSEFITCLSDPTRPGQIELIASRDDPRLERGEGFAMIRERGWPTIEWTLPVVDCTRTMQALAKELRHKRVGRSASYNCHPMHARGKAITLTTLRPAPPRPGLLARLGFRRRTA